VLPCCRAAVLPCCRAAVLPCRHHPQSVLQDEDDQEWLDYEEDETAVKCDIADAILDDLIVDTMREVQGVRERRQRPGKAGK
jgi:hypothetical protein